MRFIRRYALGIGIMLFAMGAIFALYPVRKSGIECGSPINQEKVLVDLVPIATENGTIVRLPDKSQVAAREDCQHQRERHALMAGSMAVSGLVGVFWSVIGAPEDQRSRRYGLVAGG